MKHTFAVWGRNQQEFVAIGWKPTFLATFGNRIKALGIGNERAFDLMAPPKWPADGVTRAASPLPLRCTFWGAGTRGDWRF